MGKSSFGRLFMRDNGDTLRGTKRQRRRVVAPVQRETPGLWGDSTVSRHDRNTGQRGPRAASSLAVSNGEVSMTW